MCEEYNMNSIVIVFKAQTYQGGDYHYATVHTQNDVDIDWTFRTKTVIKYEYTDWHDGQSREYDLTIDHEWNDGIDYYYITHSKRCSFKKTCSSLDDLIDFLESGGLRSEIVFTSFVNSHDGSNRYGLTSQDGVEEYEQGEHSNLAKEMYNYSRLITYEEANNYFKLTE